MACYVAADLLVEADKLCVKPMALLARRKKWGSSTNSRRLRHQHCQHLPPIVHVLVFMGVQFLYIFRTWAIRYITLFLYIRAFLEKCQLMVVPLVILNYFLSSVVLDRPVLSAVYVHMSIWFPYFRPLDSKSSGRFSSLWCHFRGYFRQ